MTAIRVTGDPLAHLGLARAYALHCNSTKTKVAYQDFLTLWKDADPDYPHIQASEGGVAKLQ